MNRQSIILFLKLLLVIFFATSCASIGSPDGGPYDETPPSVVACRPNNMSTNNSSNKVTIYFDEFIVLENATEKIVVSPPQQEMPTIRTAGKKINVILNDTLRPNTTYTIDFSDAITDNNENNPMGNYTYAFSTGMEIDTLEVSGTLLEAENLEPIKGMLVGLHSNLSDSAFICKPFDRVSRTDGSGHFYIKGVAPGTYRLYALDDADGDFIYGQRSEKLAFDTTIITPYCALDTRYDTTWIDSTHVDTIKSIPYMHFYPDDIILRAFTVATQDLHLLKMERPIPDKFTIFFTASSDTIPHITPLNFSSLESIILERSLTNDTLTYWITDTLVSNLDTLTFAMTYLDTDTLGSLVEITDTFDLIPKITRNKQRKELEEKIKEWEAIQKKERRRQKDKFVERPNPNLREVLSYRMFPSTGIIPTQNVRFKFEEPIAKVDTSLMHFFIQVDTLWNEVPFLFLPKEDDITSYMLYAEWRPGERYKLEADSNAVISILGKQTNRIKKEIRVFPEEELSALFVHLITADTGVIIQVLDNNDKVVRSQRAVDNRADFFYLKPGSYYLRTIVDANGDGEWTPGDYAAGVQPEEVFYFPKPLILRPLWEVEQDWEMRANPIEKQKPEEITKQKPDAKKEIKKRNAEREKNK